MINKLNEDVPSYNEIFNWYVAIGLLTLVNFIDNSHIRLSIRNEKDWIFCLILSLSGKLHILLFFYKRSLFVPCSLMLVQCVSIMPRWQSIPIDLLRENKTHCSQCSLFGHTHICTHIHTLTHTHTKTNTKYLPLFSCSTFYDEMIADCCMCYSTFK
jgi:hypothetical protein